MFHKKLINKPTWTPDEDDELRRLAATGLGVRAVADSMRKSVGAVAGRGSRLKIQFKQPTKPPKPRRRVKKISKQPILINAKPLPPSSYQKPVTHGKELWELGAEECSYPLGELMAKPPYKFCGQAKQLGVSYCPYHMRIAWRPAPQRASAAKQQLRIEAAQAVKSFGSL